MQSVRNVLSFVVSSIVSSMAAYGGHEATGQNQIFVTLRRGKVWPPKTTDVRVRYEDTIGDVKAAVAVKLGVPADKQQLFHHKRELTPEDDNKTLLDMNMHTGFALAGYDMTEEPEYWPPVKRGKDGFLVIDC